MSLRYSHQDLFRSLRALEEATFPKVCRNCGHRYEDAAEFLAATRQVRPDHTGLKEGIDEDGAAIVEVFRNCACGSTLLETFSDRRDQSPGACGGASALARCSTSWWPTASNTPGPGTNCSSSCAASPTT